MELVVGNELAEDQLIELGRAEVEDEEYKEDGEQKEDEELKPWEQHSAVISIPRYDYKAPSSLLERPHSGFLITCPLKREKSATKEAIPILDEHLGFVGTRDTESSNPCNKNVVVKRRRICSKDAEILDSIVKDEDLNLSEESCEATKGTSFPPEADGNVKGNPNFSLAKLTRSGLLLFTSPHLNSHHVVDTLSSIFQSLESGNLKQPIWCHRIFPIQEICCLIEKDLQAVVTNLVQKYFSSHQNKPERSIKFAVGYNRRGIDETEMKNPKSASAVPLLERNKCLTIVAGAFKNVVNNSLVDLKSPEVVVLVELLPLSGLPSGPLLVGVSVLPCELVMTKPRLCIKSLFMSTKETKKKG